LLGTDTPLTWKTTSHETQINIPEDVRRKAGGKYAWVVKISGIIK